MTRIRLKNMASVVLGLVLMALPAVFAGADEAADRGYEIALEADKRSEGFEDFSAELEMVLLDRQGRESRRSLRNRTLEGDDSGDRTLVVFDHPADVKGTALLIVNHSTGNDDLWLYLPALKRVKRISGNNKSGPFMGSEFAYEDLTSTEVDKFTYRFVREEELDGVPTFVIERDPVDPKSGYQRQVVWIDQEHYRTLKIDYYDRKNTLLKTLVQSGFDLYTDRFWRPSKLYMENHQNNKKSELIWSNYNFGNGFDERDFDRASLARAK